jgi:hypothetical protein
MKELIEWMEQELKGHELIGSDYGLGLRSGISRCIAKAKELEAANCDRKDCRNNSQYLRQNHSDDKLDMHTPKVGEKWRGVPPDGVFNNDYTDDYNPHIEPCQKSTPDSAAAPTPRQCGKGGSGNQTKINTRCKNLYRC